jgi:hypothetical protein
LNVPALFGAGAASTAVWAHGIVGQRWFVAQLGSIALRPTKPWGDADVTWRVFAGRVAHRDGGLPCFGCDAYVVAFGVESRELLRFISIVYAVFLGIGFVYLSKRLDRLRRPFPVVVLTCLVGVSLFAWLA